MVQLVDVIYHICYWPIAMLLFSLDKFFLLNINLWNSLLSLLITTFNFCLFFE
jgi:hypothetical protein